MHRWLARLDQSPGLRLVLLACIAVLASWLPFVGAALGWYETFFHELSHGIVALASGGSIATIELAFDGSGQIRYFGAWSPTLVTFAGYPGAVLFGTLLYLAAARGRDARAMAAVIAATIVVSMLLWMRDLTSIMVAACMAIVLAALWYWTGRPLAKLALQVIALALMLSGLKSIWSLVGHADRGDAAILSDMTRLPGFVFPPVWLALGLAVIVWLWKKEAGKAGRGGTNRPGRRAG